MNSFGLPAATVSHSEGTSNIFDSESGSTIPRPVERPQSSRPPRREVRWVHLGTNSQSLESIAHNFQDYIDCFLSSSSSTLRRVRALDEPPFHTCPGYLREEITLTAEVSKSAIVSHASADLWERCSFCGQLVDNGFERDFGKWFDSDETKTLQRFWDQEKEVPANPSPTTPSELLQGTKFSVNNTKTQTIPPSDIMPMDTMRGPEQDLPESVIYDTVSANNILIPGRDAI